MRQSNVIFGTLIFMFVVYVTMRGQLPGYLSLFKPKAKGGGSTGATGDVVGKAKSLALDAAQNWVMSQLGVD